MIPDIRGYRARLDGRSTGIDTCPLRMAHGHAHPHAFAREPIDDPSAEKATSPEYSDQHPRIYSGSARTSVNLRASNREAFEPSSHQRFGSLCIIPAGESGQVCGVPSAVYECSPVSGTKLTGKS